MKHLYLASILLLFAYSCSKQVAEPDTLPSESSNVTISLSGMPTTQSVTFNSTVKLSDYWVEYYGHCIFEDKEELDLDKSLFYSFKGGDKIVKNEFSTTISPHYGNFVDGVTYYARAFIKNSSGIVFSKPLAFTVVDFVPDEYNISSQFLQTLFFDDFLDNTNNWYETNTSDFYAHVYSSYYYVKNTTSDYFFQTTLPIIRDTSKNFQIEALLSMDASYSSSRFGILFNADANNYSFFSFVYQPYYYTCKIQHHNNDGWLNDITSTSYNTSTEYNKLTIRKFQGTYYFFMNEDFVFSTSNIDWYGNDIGFYVSPGEIKVDWIRVSYINL